MRTFPQTDRRCEYVIWSGHCCCVLVPDQFLFRRTRQTSQFEIGCNSSLCVWEWDRIGRKFCQESERILTGIESSGRNWIRWFTYWIVNTERIEARKAITDAKNLYSKHFPDCSCANSHRIIHTCSFVYSISCTNFQLSASVAKSTAQKEYQGQKR